MTVVPFPTPPADPAPAADGESVASAIDRHLDSVQTKTTRDSYAETLARLTVRAGDRPAAALTPEDYAAVMDRWDGTAAATWNRHLSALTSLTAWAQRQEILEPRAAAGAPQARPPRRPLHPAHTPGQAVHRRPARPSRAGPVADAVRDRRPRRRTPVPQHRGPRPGVPAQRDAAQRPQQPCPADDRGRAGNVHDVPLKLQPHNPHRGRTQCRGGQICAGGVEAKRIILGPHAKGRRTDSHRSPSRSGPATVGRGSVRDRPPNGRRRPRHQLRQGPGPKGLAGGKVRIERVHHFHDLRRPHGVPSRAALARQHRQALPGRVHRRRWRSSRRGSRRRVRRNP